MIKYVYWVSKFLNIKLVLFYVMRIIYKFGGKTTKLQRAQLCQAVAAAKTETL